MIIALLIVIGIMGYLFIGGMVGYAFYKSRKVLCKDCRRADATKNEKHSYNRYDCLSDHGTPAALFGAGWPFTIPILLGALTSNYMSNRENRAERKEKSRVAEHERKMIEIEAQRVATIESVKFLVENGVKADVPGLFESEGTS